MNFATCTSDSQQFYGAVTDTGLAPLCPRPKPRNWTTTAKVPLLSVPVGGASPGRMR